MAFTVTATQGGSTASGLALRVYVLTQAAATQNGATANTNYTNNATWTLSITTTQAGSRVYGAASRSAPGTASVAAAATTLVDDISDGTNGERYVTFKATSLTGTPGATTLGFTVAGGASGPLAMAEILTAGTLTEDGSAPAAASTTAATAVTTASFTPPAGSLLVALVASDGGATVTTMALSDTSGLSLAWSERVKNNPSGGDYAGVWTAAVPAAGTAVTWVPQRYGQPVPDSRAPFAQRDRRDANTVGTAANPLPSPLDTAWQADGLYSHLYNDAHLRDRRQYFTQPLRLFPATTSVVTTDPTLNAQQDLARRYGLAATHYDRRLVPQQRPYVSDPLLIVPVSGPNYATAQASGTGGSGSWVTPANAEGAPDGAYATWTAP